MRIRSLFMALPAVALGLACSTPSKAHTARSEQQRGVGTAGTGMASSDVKAHASDQVITGRVATASGGSLVIESTNGDRHTLALVDQTVVTLDGHDSNVSALQPGQDVRASFNEQDGRQVAVKVEAKPVTGASPYAPASPPGTAPAEMPPGDTTNSSAMPPSTPATPPSSETSPSRPNPYAPASPPNTAPAETPPGDSTNSSAAPPSSSGTTGRGY